MQSHLNELVKEKHTYETVVLDSCDWLERQIHDAICRDYKVANIELAGGGYGKGYSFALGYWCETIAMLNKCRDKGMAVILISHAKVERFEDPESAAYDRFTPRLHKSSSALLTEWVDAVLFATRKFRIDREAKPFAKEEDARKRAVPIGADGGERILRCVGSPACIAKNRYNMPAELPLSWDAVYAAITKENK